MSVYDGFVVSHESSLLAAQLPFLHRSPAFLDPIEWCKIGPFLGLTLTCKIYVNPTGCPISGFKLDLLCCRKLVTDFVDDYVPPGVIRGFKRMKENVNRQIQVRR